MLELILCVCMWLVNCHSLLCAILLFTFVFGILYKILSADGGRRGARR